LPAGSIGPAGRTNNVAVLIQDAVAAKIEEAAITEREQHSVFPRQDRLHDTIAAFVRAD